jgi:cobalt-zinc-cadmium efflux system protein
MQYSTRLKRNLIIAIVLNGLIFTIQITVGFSTNSLSLISDAFHNFTDVIALGISYIAASMSLWKATSKKTYGYVRVEILAAFINSLSLIAIGGYIIYEAVQRVLAPPEMGGIWMLYAASFGFVANAVAAMLLHSDSQHDLNIRSAVLHLFTDALESLAVIVVAALVLWNRWYILDPLLSLAIGLFILKGAYDILREASHILTEGTPAEIDVEEVAEYMKSFPGVRNVHHVHIWRLSSQSCAISAHVSVDDRPLSAITPLSHDLDEGLRTRFNINHPTLQFETNDCCNNAIVAEASIAQPHRHNNCHDIETTPE